MKNLTLAISICSLLSYLNVFGMHSNSNNFKKIFNNRNTINLASFNNVWTKDHSDLCQRICYACSISDYEKVKETIQNCRLNVDAHDIFGSTLLHQAAIKKDARMLEALLSKKPQNINAPNLFGLTALSCFLCSFYAYKDLNDELEDFFVSFSSTKSFPIPTINPTMSYIYMPKLRKRRRVDSFGVMDCSDFNSKKIKENTQTMPIYSRMPNGSAKIIVEKFLALGADVKAKDKFIGLTALHYATLAGDIETLLILINYDPRAVDELTFDGISPLDIAVNMKNTPIVTLLTKRGAKVKFENLQKSLDNFALLKALLPYKNSLFNIENGINILANYPFYRFDEDTVSFLIDKGASVDSENKNQPSFLYKFAQCYSGNNDELIYKVIKASKNINSQYYWGHTALFVAVLWKNFNTAKKLLEAGANPYIRDKIGFSVIDLANLYDSDLFEDYQSRKKRKIDNKFFI